LLALEAEHTPRERVADAAVLAADPLANVALQFPCLQEGRVESRLRIRSAALGALPVAEPFHSVAERVAALRQVRGGWCRNQILVSHGDDGSRVELGQDINCSFPATDSKCLCK
jgi:hypothetical protein